MTLYVVRCIVVTMYDKQSVNEYEHLFVSHVVYQSRTIRSMHEYTEHHLRYGGYNISPFVEKAL